MDLYGSGKVTEVEEFGGYYTAVVLGTKPYRVSISFGTINMVIALAILVKGMCFANIWLL